MAAHSCCGTPAHAAHTGLASCASAAGANTPTAIAVTATTRNFPLMPQAFPAPDQHTIRPAGEPGAELSPPRAPLSAFIGHHPDDGVNWKDKPDPGRVSANAQSTTHA